MNEEPIRVAHVIGKMVGGGVESFIMNYYRHIDRNKIQFDFIIDSDSTVVPRNEIESLGGRIIEVPPYQHTFRYIKTLVKVFKENNYKIVHSHLNTLSVFPLFAAKIAKVSIRIAHSHSTSNKKEWKKNIIKNVLKPLSKLFATDYFACSEHAGRWLFGDRTFEQGKVTLIHNAIDTDKFKFDENIRNKIRKELEIEGKFVIGHVGRFVEQKNHDFLIDIFNEVYKEKENAILLLIGDGPLEEKIKEKVKKLKLEKVVYFLGIRENVNELMQAMDFFMFPSLYEGLGIVMIEAQCIGIKCLCSNEVPKEVKLSNSIEFITEFDIKKWLNNFYKINNDIGKMILSDEIVRKSGYQIKFEIKKMQEIYEQLYRGETNGK